MNLDYENIILISHEDTFKDITKKGGDKVTAIKPNLQEKAANKIAGMVDIVARVIADDNVRTLSFKTNEVIFGGGRLNVTANSIPLGYDELMRVYEEANLSSRKAASTTTEETSKPGRTARKTKDNVEVAEVKPEENVEKVDAEVVETEAEPVNKAEAVDAESTPIQETEKPTRTRRKRGE